MVATAFLRGWRNVASQRRTRSRVTASDGRIIITGTGRAGTTFLVQLFSALDFDTGYSAETAVTEVDRISHAGLEHPMVDDANPYVIKSPWYTDVLLAALDQGQIAVHAAIVPMRTLFDAAESRRRVYREAATMRLDPLAHPGSLWNTTTPWRQEGKLAEAFYNAVYALAKHGIPTYFPVFPRLAIDADYLFRAIEPLLVEHGVSRKEFVDAHARFARPDLIHPTDPSASRRR